MSIIIIIIIIIIVNIIESNYCACATALPRACCRPCNLAFVRYFLLKELRNYFVGIVLFIYCNGRGSKIQNRKTRMQAGPSSLSIHSSVSIAITQGHY